MDENKQIQVFLCHASPDKPKVRDYYRRLVSFGIDAWLDEVKLLPGDEWRETIKSAIKKSDAIIVFLSRNSINREGFVNTEISTALDVATEKRTGEIFIIPARLEECEVPDRLSERQWVNLYEDDSFPKLIKALNRRGESLGLRVLSNDELSTNGLSKIEPDPKSAATLTKYLKGLSYLYQREPDTVISLLMLIKHYDKRVQDIKTYQELATSMLIQEILKVVISTAKELILSPDTLNEFLQIIGQNYFETSENASIDGDLAQDFMRPINKLSIFNIQAKVTDLIKFYKNNTDSLRYFLVVKDNDALAGMVTINDIRHNLESLKAFSSDTLVSNLPFFNSNPKVFLTSDTMEYLNKFFDDVRLSGRYIFNVLVVNNYRKPVGLLDETAISRWRLSRNT